MYQKFIILRDFTFEEENSAHMELPESSETEDIEKYLNLIFVDAASCDVKIP